MIAGWNEPSGTLSQESSSSGDVGGDDRKASGHPFEDGVGRAFAKGRVSHGVGGFQQAADIIGLSDVQDAVEVNCLCSNLAIAISRLACQKEHRLRDRLLNRGPRSKEGFVIFE